MKLWEVIKEIEKDKNKVFESTDYGRVRLKSVGRQEHLTIENASQNSSGVFINFDRDWKEVKQSVTWQEAIEAWVNGKTIRVEMPLGDETRFWGNRLAFSTHEIKDGKWFIEGAK